MQVRNASLTIKSDTVREGSYNNVSTTETFRITLKDDGAREDYYLLRFESGTPYLNGTDKWVYHWSSFTVDYTSEPIFDKDLSALDKVMGNDWLSGYNGRAFSDELINGKEYTMNFTSRHSGSYYPVKEPDINNPEDMPEPDPTPPSLLRVVLYSLSKDYYKYLRVLQVKGDGILSNDLIDAGLAEPVRVYSNVAGGLGICGGCCKDSLLIEWLKQ